MATVKVKKKRLKVKIIIMFLIIIFLAVYLCFFLLNCVVNTNIKNIYVIGNTYLTDDDIITLAKINNYPKIYNISSSEMERRLKANLFIKSVKVEKKLGKQVYIYITENKPVLYHLQQKKLILENNTEIMIEKYESDVPILINHIEKKEIYQKLLTKLQKINAEIMDKISEVKYDPNNVDEERFLLTMNDGNYVYITLNKISEINFYMEILPTLENKKGILYLDSGKYFEILK